MPTIPAEIYGLFGTFLGAGITLLSTWLNQRGQKELESLRIQEARAQLARKEKAERVYQLAVDLTALAYSFLSITWEAEHSHLDKSLHDQYSKEIQHLMPRLYGDYVLVTGLDNDLDSMTASLVDQADALDVNIGSATLDLDGIDFSRMRALHADAESFASTITENLKSWMRKNREAA